VDSAKIARQRKTDPAAFLARLTIVAEGASEFGFIIDLLEKALNSSLEQHGIHVTDGGGHERALNFLEALAVGGLRFGGFVDEEGVYPTRWQRVEAALGKLLFRWKSGCTEKNIIDFVSDDKLEALLTDPEDEKDRNASSNTGGSPRPAGKRLHDDQGKSRRNTKGAYNDTARSLRSFSTAVLRFGKAIPAQGSKSWSMLSAPAVGTD